MIQDHLNSGLKIYIQYENNPLGIYSNISHCKIVHFQMKIFNFFLIFAQNIDRGYTLESPQ